METLFDYLSQSPLPVLVLDFNDPLGTPPLLSNYSFKVLTRGSPLLSVLTSEEAENSLRAWLSGGGNRTGGVQNGGKSNGGDLEEVERNQEEMHLTGSELLESIEELDSTELQLELRTTANAFERLNSVTWRRKTILNEIHQFIILTGIFLVPTHKPPTLPLLPSNSALSTTTSPASSTSSLLSYSESGRLNTRRHSVISAARQARPIEERLRELELITDCSMVGLARLDLQGKVLWVNDSWYTINGHDRNAPLDDWAQIILPEDLDGLMEGWSKALQVLEPCILRFRTKSHKIILAHSCPNSTDPATVTGWISNIIDVTDQMEAIAQIATEKATANLAEARREIAEEDRRQQESLLSITSHELRTPISAIIQNAELTRSSLIKIRGALANLNTTAVLLPPELGSEALAALAEDIDSLDSIAACAMAQKLIADDILGLAQIQLNKYAISPVAFDLSASLRTTMKMFASEARAKDVELVCVLGDSVAQLGTPMRIEADPTRLGQILINLLSNAIRFTGSSKGLRKVTLSIDISSSPPAPGASLMPSNDGDIIAEAGAPIYLYFKIADTGPGMSEEETLRIFEKFMQASPFTHCTMGGSGLGLFICRNLCELQGGKLEVVSQLGVGSTFRGYIACHHVDGMAQISPISSPRPYQSRLSPVESSNSTSRVFQQRLQPPSPLNTPNFSPSLLPSTISRPTSRNSSSIGYFDMPPPINPIPIVVTKKRLRILAVDDNEVNRKIVRRQLEQAGHFVETANDGQQALDLLLERGNTSWDVVIMDVQMPVLDGISATKAFRLSEIGTGKNLRIVGLTSGARDAQVKAALAAGMTCLVTKPYRLSSLLGSLEP